jgi:hypothetical protein
MSTGGSSSEETGEMPKHLIGFLCSLQISSVVIAPLFARFQRTLWRSVVTQADSTASESKQKFYTVRGRE